MSEPSPSSARCPFCRKSIAEDLLRFGGNCPHCLIEIPGEEAPTDPGAALREQQAAAEHREQTWRRRKRAIITVIAVMAVGGGVAAAVLLRPEPIHRDPAEYEFAFDITEHQDPNYDGLLDEPEAVASAQPQGSRGRSAAGSAGSRSASHPVATPAQSGGVPQTVRSAPEIADGPLEAFAVPVSIGNRGPKGIVLSDDEQISEMIGKVLARGQKQITRCYESRLNAKPGLNGTWLVDFTVETNGKASDIAVEPLDGRDRELESCISRQVSNWSFQAVNRPVPSGTKYRFSPRG